MKHGTALKNVLSSNIRALFTLLISGSIVTWTFRVPYYVTPSGESFLDDDVN